MAVRILTGEDGYQVMYCSTTMTAFGFVNCDSDNDLHDFLEWLPKDARLYSNSELSYKYYEWLEYLEKENDFLDEDYSNHSEREMER